MNRRFALHALVVVGILLAAVPAFAAKGGNGNGGSNSDLPPAWVTASPAPAEAGSLVSLEGCGYLVEPVQIRIVHSNGTTQTYGAGVYFNGCFSGTVTAGEAGAYTVEVWQHGSKQLHLRASTSLSVV